MAGRIFLLTLAFFIQLPVSAATYSASPSDDLQAKIAALNFGDTLYFNEGTYNWNDALRFGPGYTALPASAGQTITLAAAPGAVTKPHVICTTSGQNAVDMNDVSYFTFKGIEFSGGSNGFKLNNSSYITIENCHVHNTAGPAIDLKLATHHITVRGCEIDHPGGTGECFYIGSSSSEVNHQVNNCLIEQNLIHGTRAASQGDGVELKYMTYANIVRDNVLFDLGYPGIFVYGHPTRTADADLTVVEGNVIFDTDDNGIQTYGCAVIRNNIIFGTGSRGIEVRKYIDPVRQVRIVNNTLWDCNDTASDGGITLNTLSDASGVVLANNCVYSTASYALVLNPYNSPPNKSTRFYANLWHSDGHAKPVFINQTIDQFSAAEFHQWLIDNAYSATDANNSDSDPLFVNKSAYNFYPQTSSPLRDMGTTSYAPSTDFDGVARDANPDCGAYEWTASGGPIWTIGTTFKGTAVGPDHPGGGGGGGCGYSQPVGTDKGDAFFWISLLMFPAFVRLIMRRRRGSVSCGKATGT